MKVLRDKKTNELFICMNEKQGDYMMSLHDQRTVNMNDYDLEEVNTKPTHDKFRRLHVVEESFSFGCEKKWHLKDILFVPVDGKEVAFRVEHIENDRVYFVAVDVVGESNMKDMDNFLEDFLSKMPAELVSNMVEMQHKINGTLVKSGKLTVLSRGNVSDTEGKCNGTDDVLFDGLKTEAERCKNLDGETVWYWLDTPWNFDVDEDAENPVSYSAYFCLVHGGGNPYVSGYASSTCAVVPCFSIEVEPEDDMDCGFRF